MAKGKGTGITAVNRAAEAVGSALGSVAGTMDSLREQHPHPLEEARETLAAVASEAGTRAAVVIKKAKDVARRTKKVAARARQKSTPAVARVKRTVRKAVKRTKKAVKRGRKTVSRAAGRLKR